MLIPPLLPLSPSWSAAAAFWKNRRGPALAVCALALLAGPAAHGDIQKSPKAANQGERGTHRQEAPPPSAVEGKASVSLDGSVEIVLQSHGGESQEVGFLIRQPPAHGTLTGPPRQLTRNTAAVTYVHRAGDGLQDDVFTFAVQVLGGKVSAAQAVVIGVADTGPDLAATPAELDFGAVDTGDTSRAEITLENRGGGLAAGEFVPPAPWEVDGPSGYRLARGKSQTFPLVFRPVRNGSFSETIHLPGAVGARSVHLIGIGLGTLAAPVTVAGPVPPPLATPLTSASVPPADLPRVESVPAPPALSVPAGPAEPAPPPNAPAAVSAPAPGSPAVWPRTVLATFLGLGLVTCAALYARRWQGRRRAARAGGLPAAPASARGVPAKERINR